MLCCVARKEKNSFWKKYYGRLRVCSETFLDYIFSSIHIQYFLDYIFQVFIFNMNGQKWMLRISKFLKRLYICKMLLQKSLLYLLLKEEKVFWNVNLLIFLWQHIVLEYIRVLSWKMLMNIVSSWIVVGWTKNLIVIKSKVHLWK